MPFDSSKPERVKRFIEGHCTYSTGTKFKGKPFSLIPWQYEDTIVPFFGTVDENGLRQYRYCYVEIAKKNGKTELFGALALYFLCADGELGPNIYIGAADKEQAGLTYQAAAAMVRANPVMSANLKCLDSRKRIIFPKRDGYIQVLSSEADTKHGINPSAVLIDELHGHKNDALYRYLTSGTDTARDQQAVFIATTSGVYDRNSVWWRTRTHAIQVRDKIVEDPTFLPVLYIADMDDDPGNPEVWKKANPSMGYIFDEEKIRRDYESIKDRPVEFQDFKRFRLNIPLRQLVKWMPIPAWNACAKPVREETFMRRRCFGGIDLSEKIDLSAFVLLFEPDKDGVIDIVAKFYCPEESIMERSRRDKVPYNIWADQGYLIATPGATVDHDFIIQDILYTIRNYRCPEIGYDPYKATDPRNRIMKEVNPQEDPKGFQMVEVRQGGVTLHEPGQDLLVAVMEGRVRHGGHPILTWCFDNLVMKSDSNANLSPDKSKSTERIDGASATITGWSRLLFHKKKKRIISSSAVVAG